MSEPIVYQCQCPSCLHHDLHPDRLLHLRMNLLLSRLDEQQRRWYVALESMKVGYGGDRLLSQVTGMDVETIRRGRGEMEDSLRCRPTDRVRLPGAGRPLVEKKSRTSPPS
jgi:hypothetical protein